jgi:ketosteroid isomerase-like protein
MAAPALAQRSEQQVLNDLLQKYESAFNRQDAVSSAAIYTEDAIRVTPQGVLHGRDAIRKDYQAAFKAGLHDVSLTTKAVEPAGDFIWNAGEWTAKFGDQPGHGFYTGTLTRDGKIKFNMYNVTPPPTPMQQSANK